MAAPTEQTIRHTKLYLPPAITGLTGLLDQHVRDRPDATALVVGGDRIPLSYGALAALADEVAVRLSCTGLRRGDAVGLISANTVEFVVALLSAARAGLVVAPLDPGLPEPEMAERLERLGARVALVRPPTINDGPIPRLPVPIWELRVGISADATATATLETSGGLPRAANTPPGRRDDDALILFTSGTTSQAKMVPLTHANVAASVRGICGSYQLGPDDATVAVMPLFHGHGLLAVLISSLASGGRVLLPERGRFSAHTFWDDMRAARATWFTAVPTIHQILLQRSAREYPGPHAIPLRFVRSCSAPLNVETAREIAQTLRAPVLSAYGMTETTHQATSVPVPQRGSTKPGSVGPPTGVRLRVVDPHGRTCPAGAVGEVWVHGPTVARGYLADPANTARSFVDGWFRTGDLGSLDDDGYLFITGRIKNIINRGGEKISPEHVEAVLAACTGVAEAAVFAIPDETYGELVGAAVVVGQFARAEAGQILDECRRRLSPFEVPARLVVVASLPHTAKGALDRRAVQEQFAR